MLRALERCGVGHTRRRIAGQLSQGTRQRVGLAAALLGDPPLLLLDEPASGQDPEGVRAVRQLLQEAAGTCTVVISSHRLQEVQATCSRALILHRGRLCADQPVEPAGEPARSPGAPESLEQIFAQVTGGDPGPSGAGAVAAPGGGRP